MSSCYEIIKKYVGQKPVREEGEGLIDLEDIHISEGLEWLEITRFLGEGLFGIIKTKTYYFGTEVAKDKVEGRIIINYGKFANKKDKVERCVITHTGTVYAIRKRDKVLSYDNVIDGKYCKKPKRENSEQLEMLD